jgi:hypothetical protein
MYNILFYSIDCNYSKLIIKKLHDENMLNQFKLIDIAKIKDIPKIITSVPTIIVKDVNKPLIGIHAFNWIENTKYFYQKTNNIKSAMLKIPPNSNVLTTSNKINEYFEEDQYNYIDSNDIAKYKIMDSNEIIKDVKLNQTLQQRKLSELLLLRNEQFEKIISNN